MKERLKALLKAWTACSGREGRRILLLIPLLVLIALLFLWQGKPRFERSFTMRSGARFVVSGEKFPCAGG